MYNLEHDGYRNVTALKRTFAIEVEDYDDKEALLHTIFEKSRLADTELFAIDVNIVIQLLSSFDGEMVYPVDETKETVFDEAADNSKSKLIPDGMYTFLRKKKSENKMVNANAVIKNGSWTLLKDSKLGIEESPGVRNAIKLKRLSMPIDADGILLDDVDLGICSPSYAGVLVLFGATNGWIDWKNEKGESLDIYRNHDKEED